MIVPSVRSCAAWEHFPHDADVGVRGFGATPAEAFAQAALALTAVVKGSYNLDWPQYPYWGFFRRPRPTPQPIPFRRSTKPCHQVKPSKIRDVKLELGLRMTSLPLASTAIRLASTSALRLKAS